MSIKRQRTFYGDNSCRYAMEWLGNLQNCFDIKKASLVNYNVIVNKRWGSKENRTMVKVVFE